MTPRLQLTDRDRALVRASWSLGAATSGTLRALVSPGTAADTLGVRLRRLTQAGHLSVTRYVAPAGGLFLYNVGPLAIPPGEPRPWRPSLAQVQHTLDAGSAVVALTRPGFAGLSSTSWQGEAELRAWAQPGAPFPDARVSWAAGSWLVEVDRATESRAAWRRKLVRYLTHPAGGVVLALTTTDERAVNLANVAADLGVPLLATTLRAVFASSDPVVLDTRTHQRCRLSTTHAPPG